MSAQYTPELAAMREQAEASPRFEGTPRGKIRCTVCGDSGYPGGAWMDKHIEGHTLCWCGKWSPTRTFNMHRGHRNHPKKNQ
jgi:hypothetical protein